MVKSRVPFLAVVLALAPFGAAEAARSEGQIQAEEAAFADLSIAKVPG